MKAETIIALVSAITGIVALLVTAFFAWRSEKRAKDASTKETARVEAERLRQEAEDKRAQEAEKRAQEASAREAARDEAEERRAQAAEKRAQEASAREAARDEAERLRQEAEESREVAERIRVVREKQANMITAVAVSTADGPPKPGQPPRPGVKNWLVLYNPSGLPLGTVKAVVHYADHEDVVTTVRTGGIEPDWIFPAELPPDTPHDGIELWFVDAFGYEWYRDAHSILTLEKAGPNHDLARQGG